MVNENELKLRLQEIVEDDYKVPSRPELYPLVLAMGTHIGAVDLELRDDLIFEFINSKNLLRSLSFRASKIELSESVQRCIRETVATYNRF